MITLQITRFKHFRLDHSHVLTAHGMFKTSVHITIILTDNLITTVGPITAENKLRLLLMHARVSSRHTSVALVGPRKNISLLISFSV